MKTEIASNQTTVMLTGLDGSNPLAFLAAIAVLNVLDGHLSIKMSWSMKDGIWHPRLHDTTEDTLVALLEDSLVTELTVPWNLSKKLPFDATVFRDAMTTSIQGPGALDRTITDTFAAFGSEVYLDEKGQFQDTAFRMVRSGDSAGQGMPDYACKIAKQCEVKDIEAALFGPWTYASSLSSFRWDPSENREYALQAINPSKDASPTPIGVNRLAIEALILYPTMPGARGLETVGFAKAIRGKDAEFRWPIWDVPLEIDTIRSLLTCPGVFGKENSKDQLREMGVAAVFCSRQIKPNQYYRNFSPSYQA
jgi:hypothetical protein